MGHQERMESSNFPFSIWRVDTTGQFWECDAAAVGRAAGAAEAHLLRLISEKQNKKEGNSNENVQTCLSGMSSKEALSVACQCIVEALKFSKDEGDDDSWKHMKGVVLELKKASEFAVSGWSGKDLFQNYVESRDKYR